MPGPCAQALKRTLFRLLGAQGEINGVRVCQFSARHLVYCNVGRHEEKAHELRKSCSHQCPCSGKASFFLHFDFILDLTADVNGTDIGIFLLAKITSIFTNRVR